MKSCGGERSYTGLRHATPGGHASKEAGRTTGWNAKSGIEAERSGPRSLQLFARQLASYG